MNAEQIIRNLEIWPESPQVTAIPQGYTNQNFLIVASGRSYFARVAVDLPEHGVSRSNEAICSRLAAAAGIGPKVVYARDGVLVTEAVDGSPLRAGERPGAAKLAGMADLLSRVHHIVPSVDLTTVDPIAVCRGYLERLKTNRIVVSRCRDFDGTLEAAPFLRVTCFIHGDAFPENFVYDGSRMWLIDWEYAGRGDPAVDLAFVAMNFDLSPDQTQRLLDAYEGDVPLSRVTALVRVAALRDALWCLIEIETRGLSDHLAEYTRRSFRRLGIDYAP